MVPVNKMLKYFKDGNLYILKDELRQKEEPVEEPVPEKKVDDTELLF